MSSENGVMEPTPEGLKALSAVAIEKQLNINERAEVLQLRMSHFLRAFNGSVMDPRVIKERLEAVRVAWDQLDHLLSTIDKPYID